MANSFITERRTPPPGPPAPFQPPVIAQDRQAEIDQMQRDHLRLRPEERFKGGIQPHPGIAPGQHYVGIPDHVALGSRPAPMPGVAARTKYPSYRYHKTAAPKGTIVNDPDHEQEVCNGPGWQKFPFPPEVLATPAQRLELLESLLQDLAVEAKEDEEPEDVLSRIIGERNDYAKKIADTQAMKAAEVPSDAKKGK